jgi:putative peptidoglycan lipid II flippase
MVLRKEVVQILFERGRFDASATELTSSAMVFLLIGAFAFASQTVVVRGYYAIQNTLFPAIFGTLAVAFSIPIYVVGMKLMGINGVGLAISISALLQMILLFTLWNHKTANSGSRKVYAAYAKMISISIPIGFILNWTGTELYPQSWQGTLLGNMLICCISGTLFAVLMIISGYLFKIAEIKEVTNRIVCKFFVGKSP